MSYNGSGVFDPPALPNYPAVSGEVIYANRFNAVMQEIFNGLSQCITKDGQQTLTGDINFSNRKLLNVSRIIQGTLSDNGNALQIAGNANFDGTVAFTGTVTIAGGVMRFLNAGNTVGAVTPMPNYSCIFEADPDSLGNTSTYLNLNVQDNTILQLKSGSATFSQPVICDDGITIEGGITFSATYESTFIPTISGNDVPGVAGGVTASGSFTRVGKTVNFRLFISWVSHTGSGMIRIGGLPFASANVTNNYAPVAIYADSVTISGTGYTIQGYINPNSSYIDILNAPFNGGTTLPVLMEDNGSGQFIISGSYRAA